MLRRDSKWTLQVRKPGTKKSICHRVRLRFAGKSAFSQLWGRTRATRLSISARKDLQKHRLDPQRGRRRVVLWGAVGLRTYSARGAVRKAPSQSPPARPRNAPSGCFERRAPRSVPNPAPIRPFLPGSAALGRAEAHSVFAAPAAGQWGVGRARTENTHGRSLAPAACKRPNRKNQLPSENFAAS